MGNASVGTKEECFETVLWGRRPFSSTLESVGTTWGPWKFCSRPGCRCDLHIALGRNLHERVKPCWMLLTCFFLWWSTGCGCEGKQFHLDEPEWPVGVSRVGPCLLFPEPQGKSLESHFISGFWPGVRVPINQVVLATPCDVSVWWECGSETSRWWPLFSGGWRLLFFLRVERVAGCIPQRIRKRNVLKQMMLPWNTYSLIPTSLHPVLCEFWFRNGSCLSPPSLSVLGSAWMLRSVPGLPAGPHVCPVPCLVSCPGFQERFPLA